MSQYDDAYTLRQLWGNTKAKLKKGVSYKKSVLFIDYQGSYFIIYVSS